MPLPLTVCCFSEIQIGFTFLVPAHPGSPRQRAVKRVCVCVYFINVLPPGTLAGCLCYFCHTINSFVGIVLILFSGLFLPSVL